MYQTDRHGNLTDDADHWLSGQENTFDPVPDFEGMEYDDFRSGPKCGGPRYDDDDGYSSCKPVNTGCQGCRHCDPVDHESKPYGWGVEAFEDPALERANAEARADRDRLAPKYTSAWVETWGMTKGHWPHHKAGQFDHAHRDFLWRCYSTWSARRHRHSEIVWGRLCDDCGTHGEAVRRYEAWAKRAVKVRYRDEPAAKAAAVRVVKAAA